MGRRVLGGAPGRLYRAPPAESSGYHSNHLLFVWSRGATRYTASLHRTFGRDTVAVLDALVGAMRPPMALRPVIQPPVGAEGSRVVGPSIRVGSDVSAIVAARAGVWTTSYDSNRLVRIDPATARAGRSWHLPLIRRDIGWGAAAVAAGGGIVWVANADDDSVIPVREVGGAGRPIRVGDGPESVAVTRCCTWVLDRFDRTLERVDPATRRAVVVADRVGRDPTAIAVGFGSVWTVDYGGKAVIRIDQRTARRIARIPIGGRPGRITVGLGSVWTTNFSAGTVSRIDPRTNRVDATARAGETPYGISVGLGSVWVADYRGGAVMRIDPLTLHVDEWIPAGVTPLDLAIAGRSLWVAEQQVGRVLRIVPGRGRPPV